MKSTVVFTSTLSANLMSWLKNFAQKNNKTKRAVIEEALKDYKEKNKKLELKKTFIRANKDKEIIEMAEEGIEEFERQLNSFET